MGISIGDRDWGLLIIFGDGVEESGFAFWIEIGIWDLGLGLGIGDWELWIEDCGLWIGDLVWDWGFGLGLGIEIGGMDWDWDWKLG